MRTRVLKPGFFTNEQLAECEPLARILYAGLWCFADKNGCFEWRPKKMWVKILPFQSPQELNSLLEQLVREKLIIKYSDNGNDYGYIPTFLEHQSPHQRESESKIPLPEKHNLGCHAVYIHKQVQVYKNKYGEFENVKLSEEEFTKLESKLGSKTTSQYIEKLSGYIASKNKKYKSHYATILNWWRKDGGEERKQKKEPGCRKCLTYIRGMNLDDKGLCERCR